MEELTWDTALEQVADIIHNLNITHQEAFEFVDAIGEELERDLQMNLDD